MSDLSRRAFREQLNRDHPKPAHRNGRFRQRSRPYGDYLWHQDREKFEADYLEWFAEHGGKIIDLMKCLEESLAKQRASQ